MTLIQPKDLTLTRGDGVEKTYIISKFPAVQGREIVCKYPLSGIPKLGDYTVNEETMLKLMGFVSTPELLEKGTMLSTRALIDNHVGDWETLVKIEWAMMEYNCSFFANAKTSNFFEIITQKAQALLTKTWTDSLEQLSRRGEQRSTN